MKTTKKIIALLICLSTLMLLGLTVYAAGGETNLYAEVDVTEVEIGDEICLEIYVKDMTVSAIKAGFYFDNDKLEVTKITWKGITAYSEEEEDDVDNFATSKTTKTKANASGTALGVYAINSGVDSECYEGVLVTVYFDAIAAGEATITLREESAGTDAFKSDSIAPITITITATPSCNHPTTKLVPNEDSTHNVVCADEACGAIVEENVACTVDDTKTTEYTEYDANCCEPGSKFVTRYCACGAVLGDKSGSEIIPATGEHTIVKHDEQAATCTTPGRKAYWMCDQTCLSFTDADGKNKIEDFSAWMSEGGEGYLPVDPNNHTGNNTTKYDHIDDTWTHTVTVTCEDCSKPISSSTGDCVDNDGDKYCDYCGYFPLCKHGGEKYYLSTDSTNHDIYCSICNAKIGEGAHSIDESKTVEYILKPADCCFTGMKQVIKKCVCGHEMSNDTDVEIPATGEHTLVKHEKVAATCINPGIQEYWECESSGCKYTDADGKNKIEDFSAWMNEGGDGYIAVNPNNHPANRVEWRFDNEEHWQYCKDCENEVANSRHAHDYQYNAAYRCNRCSECGHMAAHNIIWEANGGTLASGMTSSANYGSTVGVNVSKNPTRDGYAFTGWTINGKPVALNGSYYEFTMPNEDVTVVAQWKCTHDEDVHEYSYTDNDDGSTHTVKCACGETVSVAEPHDYTYDAENHKCICDAVETFTLTVMDMPAAYSGTGAPDKTFTVPYGTNILDYIKEQIDLGNVDVRNQTVEDETHIGTYIFDGYWINISAGWGDVEEDSIVSGDTRISVSADYTGWNRASEDSTWGYQDKGKKVVGWYEIDGKWYYFFKNEESGYTFRAEGLTRVPYPTVKVDGNTYAPKAEDLAYNPNFKDATEAWFLFDANGVFQSTETGMAVNVDGDSCYMVNGMIPWHLGFVDVENVGYMYFAGDADLGGNKPVTGFVRAIRDYNTGKPVGSNCIYYFEIPALAMYEGVEEVEGKLYYFDSDNKLALGAGIVRTVGGYVFVRSSGELALNDYWVTVAKANGYLEGDKLYNFGEDGYLTINPSRNGIIDGVYYKEGVPFYAGLIEIEGDIYYVKSNGEVVTGTYYVTKTNGMDGFKRGDKLVFGEDGKMEEVKNGVIDGYYYENNHIKYGAGLIKLGDDVYYVRSNGQVATGWYFITTTNDMPGFKKGEKYCFGEDGKLINE